MRMNKKPRSGQPRFFIYVAGAGLEPPVPAENPVRGLGDNWLTQRAGSHGAIH